MLCLLITVNTVAPTVIINVWTASVYITAASPPTKYSSNSTTVTAMMTVNHWSGDTNTMNACFNCVPNYNNNNDKVFVLSYMAEWTIAGNELSRPVSTTTVISACWRLIPCFYVDIDLCKAPLSLYNYDDDDSEAPFLSSGEIVIPTLRPTNSLNSVEVPLNNERTNKQIA